jgi:D-glycero-D-manno-heptose 1,7-bisphosphate phosphatase
MVMPTVLVDRDGVINENRPDYVKSWEEFSFLPGALEGLAALRAAGVRVAVATNQSAVGRGLLTAEALDLIHRCMRETVRSLGGHIEDILCCPHAPWERCLCRKPQPGLLLTALARMDERPGRSFFVGDTLDDLTAAREAGVPFVMVRTGRGREELARLDGQQPPAYVADDLRQACRWILARMPVFGTEVA